MLFHNYLSKKPETETMKAILETDIEQIVTILRCSTGKFDGIVKQILVTHLNEGISNYQ